MTRSEGGEPAKHLRVPPNRVLPANQWRVEGLGQSQALYQALLSPHAKKLAFPSYDVRGLEDRWFIAQYRQTL